MLAVIVVTATVVVLGLMVLNPKQGMVLLWPMLFAYPQYYMFQLRLLPLNIGVDDLFICVFFIVVFVRRNMMGRVPVRAGFAVWNSLLFTLVLIILNVNSYFLTGGAEWEECLKAALKGGILVCLTYSLANCIDDAKDLRTLALAFCFFVAIGSIIVILQNFFPGPLKIFAAAWKRKGWSGARSSSAPPAPS
ncbi:MAG: hypothetical protein V2A79_13880 [Planctomycetota bacterium]